MHLSLPSPIASRQERGPFGKPDLPMDTPRRHRQSVTGADVPQDQASRARQPVITYGSRADVGIPSFQSLAITSSGTTARRRPERFFERDRLDHAE